MNSRLLDIRNKYLGKPQAPRPQQSSVRHNGDGIGQSISEQIQSQMQALTKQRGLLTQPTQSTVQRFGSTLNTMLSSAFTQTQTDVTSTISGSTSINSKRLILNKRFPATRPRVISVGATSTMLSTTSALQSVQGKPSQAGQVKPAAPTINATAKNIAPKKLKRQSGQKK